ncbi:sulfotransferase domain-containing protein [Phenylobacterium sp.]|uniref:sulfotransferase family protein n=1 Tax=Phenylobacterium sp. TaxID=1871053 RepID=UPI0025CEDEA1|nr:sulfotransferase domain-containing protein [Phenylobacterium sp.]
MASAPLVSFVIAGVQKGGTTALFDYLGDYPDICLPQFKELHVFDDDRRDWGRADYADYHARFPDAAGRPCGEATPIYTYWPNCLERIAAYNPDMKLIVVLRDPVQRAWSHWRMEYARGVETHPFAWCIRGGRQRLFDAEPWGFHREFSYVERGFYGEQMERLYGLFPRAQVLVLTSDDLRANPAATLGQVRTFLGLPAGATPTPREVHVGREMDYPSELTLADIEHLRSVYAADAERLAALTGLRFG